MKQEKLYKSRRIAGRILSISSIVFLFSCVGASLIYKLSDQPFYFFNTRFDVVLTDSMSSKNVDHLDFLEGHDDQIQAFDFVLSERVHDDTELDVYDVVIFDNPDIGTDMHRIVEIEDIGETFSLYNIKRNQTYGVEAFAFTDVSSSIFMDTTLMFDSVEIVTYSLNPFDVSEYYFNINNQAVDMDIVSTLKGDYYENYLTYHRMDASPATFSITKRSYEFDSSFASIHLFGGQKECLLLPSLVQNEAHQIVMFNVCQRYKIRGDKAKTDDGWYRRDQIEAKVTHVIPKFGYVARFISSPYGAILLIGIAMIPMLYWLIFEGKERKRHEK